MKIKTAVTIFILSSFFFFASFLFVSAQTHIDGGTYPVSISAVIDSDLYSQLSLAPTTVEIIQPSTVSIRILDPNGNPIEGRNVVIYIEGNSNGVVITQPSLTNYSGETTGSLYSTIPGTYRVCAKDVSEGIDIFILDCETLYVTPVPIPTINSEPPYTSGNSNIILWYMSGSGTYQYYAESSTNQMFTTIFSNSSWINSLGYNFQNLQNSQIYFYHVKARNQYGGESSWSNYVFSVQDSSGPEITLIDISGIGVNTTTNFDENYIVNIRYRIKDNVSVSSKDFWCIGEGDTRYDCTFIHSSVGDFWDIAIKLGDLELDEGGNLKIEYSFCVEASDPVGNITRNCSTRLRIPTETTGEEPEEPEPPKPPIVDVVEEVTEVVTTVIENIVGRIEAPVLRDTTITATAANITIGFSILLGGLGSLPYFLLQVILALLSLLGFRKKGSVAGYVYDSITKEPISQAIVRVYDKENILVWTDVTNGNGYFTSIELEDGKYSIKVAARNYIFPSKIIFGDTDFPLENVYHGESFASKEKRIPDFSIPLDKVEMKKWDIVYQKFMSRTKFIWKSLHIVLFIVGLIFSLYALSVTKVWWNYLVVVLYIPAFFMLLFSLFGKREKYGTVRNEKGDLLENVIVGLREMEFDKLVSKRVTNNLGKYRFVVDEGEYSIVILNSDFKLVDPDGKLVNIKVKEKGMNIVCPDVVVKRLEDTSTEDVIEPLEELN